MSKDTKRLNTYAKEKDGELHFTNKMELVEFLLSNRDKSFQVTIVRETGVRTSKQNDSIHLYLSWVARELINQGHTLQDVVERIRKAEITPTTENLKEVMWKPMQKVILNKNSTTELSKLEVDEVYEPLSMWLSKEFQIDLPFPSENLSENYN